MHAFFFVFVFVFVFLSVHRTRWWDVLPWALAWWLGRKHPRVLRWIGIRVCGLVAVLHNTLHRDALIEKSAGDIDQRLEGRFWPVVVAVLVLLVALLL